MKLLIPTIINLILCSVLLYVAINKLICGLENYQLWAGVVITILVAIIVYSLAVMIMQFLSVLIAIVVVLAVAWFLITPQTHALKFTEVKENDYRN